jgi:hypothetical protein
MDSAKLNWKIIFIQNNNHQDIVNYLKKKNINTNQFQVREKLMDNPMDIDNYI